MRRSQRGGIIFKLVVLLALLVLLAGAYLVRHALLRAIAGFWVVDDGPTTADAIVILGDDNYLGERASRAAELYRSRWAPRIVASGRMLRPYAGIAELMQRDLVERSVPAEAIVRAPNRADSTLEEAQAVRRLVVERGWRRILVVTSNYHTRRSRYIYRRVFPATMEVRIVPARDSDYNPEWWWRSRGGLKIFLHEAVGFPVAMWELRNAEASRGWTPAPSAVASRPQDLPAR